VLTLEWRSARRSGQFSADGRTCVDNLSNDFPREDTSPTNDVCRGRRVASGLFAKGQRWDAVRRCSQFVPTYRASQRNGPNRGLPAFHRVGVK